MNWHDYINYIQSIEFVKNIQSFNNLCCCNYIILLFDNVVDIIIEFCMYTYFILCLSQSILGKHGNRKKEHSSNSESPYHEDQVRNCAVTMAKCNVIHQFGLYLLDEAAL